MARARTTTTTTIKIATILNDSDDNVGLDCVWSGGAGTVPETLSFAVVSADPAWHGGFSMSFSLEIRDLDNGCYTQVPGTSSCFKAAGCGGQACDDGDPSTSSDVCTEGMETCSGISTAHSCTCSNGTPTDVNGSGATMCEASYEDCSACDAGYSLSGPAGLGSQTCLENQCAAVQFAVGVVPGITDGCSDGLVLSTHTDATCNVQCDTALGYLARNATITCAGSALNGDPTSGMPTCVGTLICCSVAPSSGLLVSMSSCPVVLTFVVFFVCSPRKLPPWCTKNSTLLSTAERVFRQKIGNLLLLLLQKSVFLASVLASPAYQSRLCFLHVSYSP